jgi:DNA-binding response OmpR family regulator
MRVLVIDDEPVISDMLQEYIQSKGHSCITASDGAEGFKAIKAEHFDLIILDLRMPELSGYDVLRLLAYGGLLHGERVVILTASQITNKEKEAMKSAGVTDILSKPFAWETIDRLLEYVPHQDS